MAADQQQGEAGRRGGLQPEPPSAESLPGPSSAGLAPARPPGVTAGPKTTVVRRATCHVTGYHNGLRLRLTFFPTFFPAFQNYLALHRRSVGPQLDPKTVNSWRPDDVVGFFKRTSDRPGKITLWTRKLNSSLDHQVIFADPKGNLGPLNLFLFKSCLHLVKDSTVLRKCDACGALFIKQHSCSFRRRSYFHHIILHDTRTWWKPIKFQPLGSLMCTQRLYLVYDIETYTLHTVHGKQLCPYLLVFQFLGDPPLQKLGFQAAEELGYVPRRNCWIHFDWERDNIGQRFKLLRNALQTKLANQIWEGFRADHDLPEQGVDYAELVKRQSEGTLDASALPVYVELIVVGHNIVGFDEIILAAHVLEGAATSIHPAFKITRNFLPRAGKILFNDLLFSLPNPAYKAHDHETYRRWKSGSVAVVDYKWQGLRVMVRDTYMLTHCSLREAAAAYQLEVNKGSCPYQALNDFFMIGTYEQEENGYPVRRYWSSDREYEENKPPAGERYPLLENTVDYCIDDVLVTSSLVMALLKAYATFCQHSLKLDCAFHCFQRPTISSTTHAMFKQMHYTHSARQGKYLEDIHTPSGQMYDFVRLSVKGGRCYPSYLGVLDEPLYVYDICGMYASALSHPMPCGRTLPPLDASIEIRRFQDKLDKPHKISYFDPNLKPMIVAADCIPPPLNELDVLPPLCSKASGRLCWTNEPLVGEVLTSIDLITLHNRQWKVKILVGNACYAVWPEWKCLCRDYVKLNIEAKEKADREKNQTQRSISKLLSNALYGSFCTRLDNKSVVFESELSSDKADAIRNGKEIVTAVTTLVSKSMPRIDLPKEFWLARERELRQADGAAGENLPQVADDDDDKVESAPCALPPFIGEATRTPHTSFLSADADELTLLTLRKEDELIENDRYPTQLASFVLAWSRAFMSEWAEILFEEDRGVPLEDRQLKSVYGDTDSVFLTAAGHRLMQTRGVHRLKGAGKPLVYEEGNGLTWLVECETGCPDCKTPAFATQSVFLAPKLYALKDVYCPRCDKTLPGKLRAKGHAKEGLNYDVLVKCFLENYLTEGKREKFETSRTVMQRTLINAAGQGTPFTVTEKKLVRVLRPWHDPTMAEGKRTNRGVLLYPYDAKRPNPRPSRSLQENPFWESTSETA
nr:DNA-dependent DNA polymerase [Bearded dragon adenovirus 1]